MKIISDPGRLLASCDYPAEHWVHLRTTNARVNFRHRQAPDQGDQGTRLPGSGPGDGIQAHRVSARALARRGRNPTSSLSSGPEPASNAASSSNDQTSPHHQQQGQLPKRSLSTGLDNCSRPRPRCYSLVEFQVVGDRQQQVLLRAPEKDRGVAQGAALRGGCNGGEHPVRGAFPQPGCSVSRHRGTSARRFRLPHRSSGRCTPAAPPRPRG